MIPYIWLTAPSLIQSGKFYFSFMSVGHMWTQWCICAYSCVCMWEGMFLLWPMSVIRGQQLQLSIFVLHLFWSRISCSSWRWPGYQAHYKLRIPISISHFPIGTWIIKVCYHIWLYVSFGYPNSGPYTYMMHTLSTESCLQPQKNSVFLGWVVKSPHWLSVNEIPRASPTYSGILYGPSRP